MKFTIIMGIGAVILLATAAVIWVIVEDPAKASRKAYQEMQAIDEQPTPRSTPTPGSATTSATPEPVLPEAPVFATPPPRSDVNVTAPGYVEKLPDAYISPTDGMTSDGMPRPSQLPAIPDRIAPVRTETPPVPDGLIRSGVPGDMQNRTSAAPAPIIATAPDRYLFNNLSATATNASPLLFSSDDPTDTLNRSTFAPQGESIQLALITNFISANESEVPVEAAVLQPFYFQGRKLLEFGDKVLGTASPGKKRDRARISWTKIIFKDGRSLSIDAVALAPDGSLGVPGYQVGSVYLNAIAPVLFEAASAWINTLKDFVLVGQGPTQFGYENASGGVQFIPDTANANLSSAQGALSTISDILAEQVDENRPYLVIPAGTRCRAFLQNYIDVSAAGYGK